MTDLNLRDLDGPAHELTPAFGAALAEAAAVCLDDQGHTSGTDLTVAGAYADTYRLRWRRSSARSRRTWQDLEVTTEHGAYGLAALLIQACANLKIVERSRKGTGFDFWLANSGDAGPLFQNKGRLEVSGIRTGDDAQVRNRTSAKVAQTTRSSSTLPTFVIVVEFSAPQSRVHRR